MTQNTSSDRLELNWHFPPAAVDGSRSCVVNFAMSVGTLEPADYKVIAEEFEVTAATKGQAALAALKQVWRRWLEEQEMQGET